MISDSTPTRTPFRLAPLRQGLAATTLLFVLGLGGLAGAQSDSRQTINFVFDQKRPGSSTGVHLAIDYFNPTDLNAKPPAVQTVAETLAPGTVIDTSVPERCVASDAQLMGQGPTACPAASRVGGGQVDLDTGIEGPTRVLQFNITQFNNKDELILLFEPTNGLPTRSVSRARIEGRTITAQVPPIPGGPPDGFTAIKRVRLNLESISTRQAGGKRNYLTTPTTCPGEGSWTNEIIFTYRDGESQTATSRSPCLDRQRPRPVWAEG